MGMSNGCGVMVGMIGFWFMGLVLDIVCDFWVVAFNMFGYLCVGGVAAYLRYVMVE